jgi:hypothetical protein
LRIYGDGSAGAKTVDASGTLLDTNLQYTSFTVAAGVVLTVESGTVIRCTGDFVNNGAINVEPGALGSTHSVANSDIFSNLSPAHPGVSNRAAAPGSKGPAPDLQLGTAAFLSDFRRGRSAIRASTPAEGEAVRPA